jgi:hypothetical protein
MISILHHIYEMILKSYEKSILKYFIIHTNPFHLPSTELGECPICYEAISKYNNKCTTICNHSFCLECLVNSQRNSNVCPICRGKIRDAHELDYDPMDDYEPQSEDQCAIEFITESLEKKGFTMLDMVSIHLERYGKNDSKYRYLHCVNLWHEITLFIDNLDNDTIEEYEEFKLMTLEDSRDRESRP